MSSASWSAPEGGTPPPQAAQWQHLSGAGAEPVSGAAAPLQLHEGQGNNKMHRSCDWLLLTHIEATEGRGGQAKSQQVQSPAAGLTKGPDWKTGWAVSAVVIASSRKQR